MRPTSKQLYIMNANYLLNILHTHKHRVTQSNRRSEPRSALAIEVVLATMRREKSAHFGLTDESRNHVFEWRRAGRRHSCMRLFVNRRHPRKQIKTCRIISLVRFAEWTLGSVGVCVGGGGVVGVVWVGGVLCVCGCCCVVACGVISNFKPVCMTRP